MPRKHATKDIDYLGKLDAVPLAAIGEYLTSKHNQKNFMKPPNFDSPGDALESSYILAKLENELLSKHLHLLEEHKKLQNKVSEQRIHKTAKDQAELRHVFINVNTLLRDMNEKKKVAYRKILHEMEEQQKLNADIEEKTKRFNDLKVFRKVLKSNADEYKIYETVLNDAAKKLNLASIRPLINRCDAIMVAQNDIVRLDDEKVAAIDGMRKRIIEIIKQAELVYGGLINELALMSRSYSKAQYECLRWERILLDANKAIISKNMEKEIIRDGIHHMYRTLCRWKHIDPQLVRVNVAQCLEFIKNEVEVIRDCVDEYHNRKI